MIIKIIKSNKTINKKRKIVIMKKNIDGNYQKQFYCCILF